MLNVSVISLICSKSNVLSPFISSSCPLSMVGAHFRRQFSPIFFSCKPTLLVVSSSSFSSMLSSAFVISSYTQISASTHYDVSATSPSVFFFASTFTGISATVAGGCIKDTAGGYLWMSECSMRNSSSTVYGGAIYKQTGNFSLVRCCFQFCNVAQNSVDNVFGNAMFMLNSVGISKENSINSCGTTKTLTGDTPTVVESGTISAKLENYTDNIGYDGSVSILLYMNTDNCSFSMSQVERGYSRTGYEISQCTVTLSQLNTINNTEYGTYFAYGTALTFSYCIFLGNSMTGTSGSVTFLSCLADFSGTGITQVTSTSFTVYSGPRGDACYGSSSYRFTECLHLWQDCAFGALALIAFLNE